MFRKSAVLHRDLRRDLPVLTKAQGRHCILENGAKILDAAGGAAVACLGHGDPRVKEAISRQLDQVAYCATGFYTTDVCEQLCQHLVDSTRGQMARVYIVNSGSEAMEAAIKMARQYHLEKQSPEPSRIRFISRNRSYHGVTMGALSVGQHKERRAKFESTLQCNVSSVSPCYAYREKHTGETDEAYMQRLAEELDREFLRVGPETVCAFVAEPVSGASLGCVPAVPGYFEAIRAVCDKHGALLILDEVMSGMGRTGTLHAWEAEGIVPDIQAIGKGLGAGFVPVSGVLANQRVVDALQRGTGVFSHAQTFQGHPISCAAALEVQRIIQADNLLANVREMGQELSGLLKRLLSDHPNVGDIRGKGLFWGIEFVQDKLSKKSFPKEALVAYKMTLLAFTAYGIQVYPGSGTVDGDVGDHIILAPAYNSTRDEIGVIANTVNRLVHDFFSENSQKACTA
ncbi:pyridoxal phosphate-dependent transferase [Dactylonectria estremocensis]|uniref:Pyridoxal phosphate-dependent transferase n=1 Tax=Dactylonectria estremocensis TaxID=1079267 RepID=A0A9P9DAM9_9HYPO|nr:pyridoxal phosphate-dependent transferase [Dactylonectria estremocensis]